MKLTFIVGAGGTGSYFIDEVINYYNALGEAHRVIVVDGDKVEEKNLVRQGFLRMDLGKGKASSLVNRYKNIVRDFIKLEYKDSFIGGVSDIVKIIGNGEYEEITLVSCVDNNMARLRITFGAYALRDIYGCTVNFVDSGNEEWYGQTLTTSLKKSGETYLSGMYGLVQDSGYEGLKGYKLRKTTKEHIYSGIFTKNDNWKNNLTKGDHEISCDDITESNPQNIGTNMMASKCLLMAVSLLHTKKFNGGEYVFDAKSSSIGRNYEGVKIEEGYEERIQELLEYVKTEEGFKEVFKGVYREIEESQELEEITEEVEQEGEPTKEVGEKLVEEPSEEIYGESTERLTEELTDKLLQELELEDEMKEEYKGIEDDLKDLDWLDEIMDEVSLREIYKASIDDIKELDDLLLSSDVQEDYGSLSLDLGNIEETDVEKLLDELLGNNLGDGK